MKCGAPGNRVLGERMAVMFCWACRPCSDFELYPEISGKLLEPLSWEKTWSYEFVEKLSPAASWKIG